MKGFELVFFRHGIASEFGITGDHDRALVIGQNPGGDLLDALVYRQLNIFPVGRLAHTQKVNLLATAVHLNLLAADRSL